MANKSNDKKDTTRQIQQSILPEAPEVTRKKMRRMLAGFRQDLAAHPYLRGHQGPGYRIRRFSLPFSHTRRQIILLIGTGLACLAILMTIVFFNHTPTWADVEEKFGIIDYCSVTVYMRHSPHNPSASPTVAQYWFDGDGRARIHIGNYVVFHSRYSPIQSFDIKMRRRGFPMNPLGNFLRDFERTRRSGTSTLRSIMNALTGEGLINTTDLLISDANVAQDLLVFDAQTRDTLWWLRVWALRKSRLPIRILKWHKKNSRYVELIFTYSKEQPPEFFDPDAFAAVLDDPSVSSHRLMNFLLRDPGGQSFPTPGS